MDQACISLFALSQRTGRQQGLSACLFQTERGSCLHRSLSPHWPAQLNETWSEPHPFKGRNTTEHPAKGTTLRNTAPKTLQLKTQPTRSSQRQDTALLSPAHTAFHSGRDIWLLRCIPVTEIRTTSLLLAISVSIQGSSFLPQVINHVCRLILWRIHQWGGGDAVL